MPEDKDDIERLTRKLLEEKGEEFVEKRYEWGILRRIYDPLQRHGIFVAETESPKKTIGMIFGELRVDPFGETECYIKEMFVEPDYRQKGIGKQLLAQLIDHLKKINVKTVKINLHLDSIKTKKLLDAFDFKPKYTVMEKSI
jgi:GNAT superfamily N-acetyltransferase